MKHVHGACQQRSTFSTHILCTLPDAQFAIMYLIFYFTMKNTYYKITINMKRYVFNIYIHLHQHIAGKCFSWITSYLNLYTLIKELSLKELSKFTITYFKKIIFSYT